MKKLNKKTIVIIVCSLFVLMALFFMFRDKIGGSGSIHTVNNGDMTMPEANGVTDEIKAKTVVEQTFKYTPDTISEVAIVFTRKYYAEGITIAIELLDGENVLASGKYKIEVIDDQHRTYLKPAKTITGVAGKELKLRIYPTTSQDTGMAIMMQENNSTTFKFGDSEVKGTLCFSISN